MNEFVNKYKVIGNVGIYAIEEGFFTEKEWLELDFFWHGQRDYDITWKGPIHDMFERCTELVWKHASFMELENKDEFLQAKLDLPITEMELRKNLEHFLCKTGEYIQLVEQDKIISRREWRKWHENLPIFQPLDDHIARCFRYVYLLYNQTPQRKYQVWFYHNMWGCPEDLKTPISECLKGPSAFYFYRSRQSISQSGPIAALPSLNDDSEDDGPFAFLHARQDDQDEDQSYLFLKGRGHGGGRQFLSLRKHSRKDLEVEEL